MKKALDIKRLKFYLWIGLGYLLLWLFVDLASGRETFFLRAVNEIWKAVYIVIINYLLFEFILPELSRKKIIRSFFLIVLTFFLYSLGFYAWRSLGVGIQVYTPYKIYARISHGVSELFGEGIFSILFFTIIMHIYSYIKLKQTAQQLRIEKQEAELNYLRSQTNPHFLFNTLNNIYSLSRDKSDLAPESILRLSKILRFMLYETGGAYVAIEQELKIITDYIELEKLRYDESLQVNFNYDVEDVKQSVPPLILIPLVENAFKHGVSETRSRPFVDIHLSVRNRQLLFSVKNSTEVQEAIIENIGLSNLRRQLELLYKDY